MAVVDVAAAHDELADLLSAYAVNSDDRLDEATAQAATCALFDATAVSLGALRHRATQAARRYAARLPAGKGVSTVWGTRRRTTPEAAALVNGVPLRCYDYNDLYVGKRSAAHPSDIIPGLVAVAEWLDAPGSKLLSSIALGYEITLDLLDTLSTAPGGWDYANVTAIGATCAVARLIGLTREQTREALAIAIIPHFASDEIESGDLNRRGDLTMWKRFNGGDAIRQAVYACTLASCGVEGVVRPFSGKLGLLRKLQSNDDPLPYFRARLAERKPLSRIAQITMKRWPVGSRAQSAIEAALAAHAKLPGDAQIQEVRVTADPSAHEHLVRSRQDPWHPISRETADHSLVYIVGAAVLDGRVDTQSFAPQTVLNPARQSFLQKIKVSPAATKAQGEAAAGYATAYPARVEIETANGAIVAGSADVPAGHPEKRFSKADLEAKLQESAGADFDADRLARSLWAIGTLASVRELTAQFAVRDGRDIDGVTVE